MFPSYIDKRLGLACRGWGGPFAFGINALLHINQKISPHFSRNVTIGLFNSSIHVPIFLLGTHSVS